MQLQLAPRPDLLRDVDREYEDAVEGAGRGAGRLEGQPQESISTSAALVGVQTKLIDVHRLARFEYAVHHVQRVGAGTQVRCPPTCDLHVEPPCPRRYVREHTGVRR